MIGYQSKVKSIAVVGLGTIGMSWAAYFLARGFTVSATDVDSASDEKARRYVDHAWQRSPSSASSSTGPTGRA